jgi:phosphohistidine swiveling domain-containing protein
MGYLKDANDVFMLHTNELIAIGSDHIDKVHTLAVADYRRQMYRGYRHLEPPGELGRDVMQSPDASDVHTVSGAVVLKGIGCSSGVIRAAARIVQTLEQADTLKPGEILVTRFTDPGWTPVLGLVGGVVTEVGGLLSHAAVIGREYGIPAVLNVPKATQILKTGQDIEIDGDRGTVTILKSASLEHHG